jgi:hypothetical protein
MRTQFARQRCKFAEQQHVSIDMHGQIGEAETAMQGTCRGASCGPALLSIILGRTASQTLLEGGTKLLAPLGSDNDVALALGEHDGHSDSAAALPAAARLRLRWLGSGNNGLHSACSKPEQQ